MYVTKSGCGRLLSAHIKAFIHSSTFRDLKWTRLLLLTSSSLEGRIASVLLGTQLSGSFAVTKKLLFCSLSVYWLQPPSHKENTNRKNGKRLCKTSFQVGMDLQKVKTQGRDENTQEDYPSMEQWIKGKTRWLPTSAACMCSRRRVVLLSSFSATVL